MLQTGDRGHGRANAAYCKRRVFLEQQAKMLKEYRMTLGRECSMKRMLSKLAKLLRITRDRTSMEVALKRARGRNTSVRTVIDVGASDGRWSLMARKIFPDASFFLVEAKKDHEDGLKKVKSSYSNIDYTISAAGDNNGTIYFDAGDLFGGAASHSPLVSNCIAVPMLTIDSLVNDKKLQPPFMLKLDTHGFEVPIFEGASETLKSTALIIVEVYNFKLNEEALRFHELCNYLESKGFSCIDIADPMHRPKDQAFWQMDMFFVSSNNKEFESNTYE